MNPWSPNVVVFIFNFIKSPAYLKIGPLWQKRILPQKMSFRTRMYRHGKKTEIIMLSFCAKNLE